MTPEQREKLRSLYRQACFGAGAEPRWEARREVEAIAAAENMRLGELLESLNLDITTWFATRPIGNG